MIKMISGAIVLLGQIGEFEFKLLLEYSSVGKLTIVEELATMAFFW